ncbi:MAG: hypothetical protein CML68_01435 [Rhodobacteraceae bacterium]|nr:hypothetical protein [Paracoccaceae bacterium]
MRVTWAALAAGLALGACSTPQNATTGGPGGTTEIQIRDGMNCYDNKCFKYSASKGTISVNGRRDTAPPAGVPLASGSISSAEFLATFQKGMQARTIGGDR